MIITRQKKLKVQRLKKRIGNGQEASRQIALAHCLPRILMIAVFIMLVVSGVNLFLPALLLAGTIDLPRTGQTTSYAAGDDGAIQAGVAWPSPRFTDNGDGTVTDNLTGLMWLKDADCFGERTWQSALNAIADFNANPGKYNCWSYTASYTDWRLPNVNELESLLNAEQADSAEWLNSQGFTNVQSVPSYWSSTTGAEDAVFAWDVSMGVGYVSYDVKRVSQCVWPVRAGRLFGSSVISPIWKTGQTTAYAKGDDGSLKMGIAWPSPRFTDNGNGTVTDNLTGLMWLKDANCIKTNYPGFDKDKTAGDGEVTWQHALDFVKGINDGNFSRCGAGYTDWRLPNRKELYSLTDFSRSNPSLPSRHPFTNVQASSHWSSTTYAKLTDDAWEVHMVGVYVYYTSYKVLYNYVWPVRAGRLFGSSVISSDTTTSTTTTSSTTTTTIPPRISVSPTGVSFTATKGGPNPSPQTVSVRNTGGGTLNWTASISPSTATWLSITPISGKAPSFITVSANISGLSAGTYNATITITASGATNSPQIIPVTLNISPAPVTTSITSTTSSTTSTTSSTTSTTTSIPATTTSSTTSTTTTTILPISPPQTIHRVRPQVIMAGFDPTIIDISDDRFDVIAVVRPGQNPIREVTLSLNQFPFSLSMFLSEILPNGDYLYRTTFNFSRGSIPMGTELGFLWGDQPGEINITAIDSVQLRHSYPNLEVLNAPEAISSVQAHTPTITPPKPIKRVGPQVIAAGFDPTIIDLSDDRFDIVALVRKGSVPISTVTISLNQTVFSMSMIRDFSLPNGDEIWRATFNFARGNIPSGTILGFLWGEKLGEINITARDMAQQKHSFPFLIVTNSPAIP